MTKFEEYTHSAEGLRYETVWRLNRKLLEDKVFPAVQSDDPKLKRTMNQVSENLDVVVSEGERLTTLDDVDRELDGFTILVADTAGVLSLGGIMGGAESEVSGETTNVLLEAAALVPDTPV